MSPAAFPNVANVFAASTACPFDIRNELAFSSAQRRTAAAWLPKMTCDAPIVSANCAAASVACLSWSTTSAAPIAAPTPFAHDFSRAPVPSTSETALVTRDVSARKRTRTSVLIGVGAARHADAPVPRHAARGAFPRAGRPGSP